jgi:hypothetical protein
VGLRAVLNLDAHEGISSVAQFRSPNERQLKVNEPAFQIALRYDFNGACQLDSAEQTVVSGPLALTSPDRLSSDHEPSFGQLDGELWANLGQHDG